MYIDKMNTNLEFISDVAADLCGAVIAAFGRKR